MKIAFQFILKYYMSVEEKERSDPRMGGGQRRMGLAGQSRLNGRGGGGVPGEGVCGGGAGGGGLAEYLLLAKIVEYCCRRLKKKGNVATRVWLGKKGGEAARYQK